MKRVVSVSGGKSSAYILANYPSDYAVFSLVRTNDKSCLYPDSGIRKIVSDKIGADFIGTLEDDIIIQTILELEQFTGKKIDWVSGQTFDEVIYKKGKGQNVYLPQANMRFCTTEMKIKPIAQYCFKKGLPVIMSIGFRANEQRRANSSLKKLNKDGLEHYKFHIGYSKNGRKKWKTLPFRKFDFPLIKDGVFKDNINTYWKNKPVKFAWVNNCVGCMNASSLYIRHQYIKNKNKIEWFIKQENKSIEMGMNRTWRIDTLKYEKIVKSFKQMELFDDDFSDCDSGYCGL